MQRHRTFYILRDKQPVAVGPEEWAKWMDPESRIVAREIVGNLLVSTVFLGLDHQFGEGPPLLFETMVFSKGEPISSICDRYSTWDEAVEGHQKIVALFTKPDAPSP